MKPIAMVTQYLSVFEDYLRTRMDEIAEYNKTTGRGTFRDGRSFVVIRHMEQCMGAEFSSVMVFGAPDSRLIELARTRMRHD